MLKDLSIIYFSISLRGGGEVKEDEIDKLKKAISKWAGERSKMEIEDEIYSQIKSISKVDLEKEVEESAKRLKKYLSISERRKALRELIEIAEADGIILREEKSLVQVISEEWSLKKLGQKMIDKTESIVEKESVRWSLLHELSFVYIASFHSAENVLDEENIDHIVEKIHEWSEGNSITDTRDAFRKALQVYSEQPKKEIIIDSVKNLKEKLPKEQRLIALDDLNEIVKSGGRVSRKERSAIENLARAWDINVNMSIRRN